MHPRAVQCSRSSLRLQPCSKDEDITIPLEQGGHPNCLPGPRGCKWVDEPGRAWVNRELTSIWEGVFSWTYVVPAMLEAWSWWIFWRSQNLDIFNVKPLKFYMLATIYIFFKSTVWAKENRCESPWAYSMHSPLTSCCHCSWSGTERRVAPAWEGLLISCVSVSTWDRHPTSALLGNWCRDEDSSHPAGQTCNRINFLSVISDHQLKVESQWEFFGVVHKMPWKCKVWKVLQWPSENLQSR